MARAGARPVECGGAVRVKASRWERARAPGLGEYCDSLARGYASLKAAPRASLADAARAERAVPGRAAPLVLAGRAEVALGSFREGFSDFERARALSPRSVEPPGALHDLAVAALRTGHPSAALGAYRALVPRAELLDDAAEEHRIFVEGAVLAMAQGPEHLTEAIGYLTRARRLAKLPELDDYLLSALALAHDRQGRISEALGVAADASGPWKLESARSRAPQAGSPVPVLPAGELDAMIAIVATLRDRDLALERWQSFLETDAGKSGPFAAHARARRDALLRATKASR